MARTYKMMLGTSGKQWEQLTVKDDGTMTMYFHGTDRSVTQQVTVITEGEWKGWLRSEKGSLFPGLESGKWNKMDDVIETTNCTNYTNNHAEPEVIEETTNYTNNEPVTMNQPRPRRQRKPRAERQSSAISHQPSDISPQTSSTLKAVGMVAAATVALFVIYETGLLIPLGLIGLATSGFLK